MAERKELLIKDIEPHFSHHCVTIQTSEVYLPADMLKHYLVTLVPHPLRATKVLGRKAGVTS